MKKLIIGTASFLIVAALCYAEVTAIKVTGSASASTNSTTTATVPGSGLIYRAVFAANNGSCDIAVVSAADGQILLSTTGTTTWVTTPTTPLATSGIIVKTANASATNVTLTGTITIQK